MEKGLEKNVIEDFVVVSILAFVFLAYLWVTFTSPIAFGDEGHYSSMGKWIVEHMIYPKYFPLMGTPVYLTPTTRLPIGYVISSSFYLFFGEAGIKIMMPFFAFLSAIMIFILFRSLGKKELGALAAFVFLMLPATVKYGVLNYPENQMIFFIAASVSFFFFGYTRNDKRYLIVSGIMLGLALLADPTAVFFAPLYFLLTIYQRKMWKKVFLVFLISVLMILPWYAREFVLFKSPCMYGIENEFCKPKMLVKPENYKLNVKLSRPEISTGAGIYKFGLVQYVRFGFGVTGLLVLIGVLFLWERRKDWKYMIFIFWLLLLILANLYISRGNPRTEDMLRYSLFGLPAIATAIAIVFDELRKRFEVKYSYIIIPGIVFSFLVFLGYYLMAYIIAIAIAFVVFISKLSEKKIYQSLASVIFIILLYSVAFYGVLEIVNMHGVKQFSPGFIEACKWVNKNLPKNATYTVVYAHPAEYNCYRRFMAVQSLPDGNIIRLWANETSYNLLKKWKIDYVLIEGFTVVPDKAFHPESEPLSFLSFLENSNHFEKVFDNTNKYGFRNGVMIFKVK